MSQPNLRDAHQELQKLYQPEVLMIQLGIRKML